MNHLQRLGSGFSIPIPPDEEGFTGRECPSPECEGYFKIEFGTGLKGDNLPCHCPYCGYIGQHDKFFTKEQIQYTKSVALRRITDAIHDDLKKLEFEHKPKGAFGIGISMKVKRGQFTPIHYYRERRLETEIICSKCTLRYSVYGVFAFCPDCGQHNSLQIFTKNIVVIGKMLDMATNVDEELAEKLIEDALENCVSSFDGFGREICRVHAPKAVNPDKAEKIHFQNLDNAKQNIIDLFHFDFAAGLTNEEWRRAIRGFQKRHLLSHKMGVIVEEYIQKSHDPEAVIGRKVSVNAEEVRKIGRIIEKLARYVADELDKTKGNP